MSLNTRPVSVAVLPVPAAENCAAVTPSDTEDLPNPGVLWIGIGGKIKVDSTGGSIGVVFQNIPNGSVLPVRMTKVYATDTTASRIVVLY